MNLQQCLCYMQENCPKGTPGGFERTKKLAAIYGNPQEELRIIHVAGTNGKGSTCAMIASILQEAGYRTGLFTSPHLERYEERIRINGKMIDAYIFSDILTDMIQFAIPRLTEEGLGHPGEFEILTVAGWIYFAGKTDFVVSEVGLGGSLDPTNLIKHPVLTIITSVSLDHCALLGNTVAEIAEEKAGIIKQGTPLVMAPQVTDAEDVIRKKAKELGVEGIYLHENSLKPIETALEGYYQQMNANTALEAIKLLMREGQVTVTEAQIVAGFRKVKWAGRMEHIRTSDGKDILLDGAHNPDGIFRLKQNLLQDYRNRDIVLFLGILDDKEQDLMLETIVPLAKKVIVTHPDHSNRAKDWKELADKVHRVAPSCECVSENHLKTGLSNAVQQLQQGQLLCITGSLYLIGDCRKYLKELRILQEF